MIPQILSTWVGRALCAVLAMFLWSGPVASSAAAQTFEPVQAVDHERICKRFLGIPTKCIDIQTPRITKTYTEQKLGTALYTETWATASHCTNVDTEAQCQRSVAISTDPQSDRLVWGRSDQFLQAYGQGGSEFAGAGYFREPRGIDITRREGDWHVAFIADAAHGRVVAVGVNYYDKRVVWMGAVDGSESGVPLSHPHDVAWDHTGSWGMGDDRIFVADTYNDRVLVYGVSIDFSSGVPVLTATYRAALGGAGSGPTQLRQPKGLAVRSFRVSHYLLTKLYVSDSGNQRAVLWHVDNTTSPITVSQGAERVEPGAEFLGMSLDNDGDLLVADRAQNRVVKLRGSDLLSLTSYGNSWNAWESGNFQAPTDVHVVHSYRSINGLLQDDVLPYVQTTERWTGSSGGQMHRLGVDAQNLGVSPGSCSASMSFLLTGQGSYTVSARNSYGSTVRTWPRVTAGSGWKSEYWDGKDNYGSNVGYGTYTFVVSHESGYTYDDGQPRYSQTGGFTMDCFNVGAWAPGYVNQKGTYSLEGSAPQPADSWRWESNFNSGGYFDWDYAQYSSFTVYAGDVYSVDWRVSARRTSDGATAAGVTSTYVEVYSNCDPMYDICPMLMDPAAVTDSASQAWSQARRLAREGRADTLRRVRGQGRAAGHFGSGAWVGGVTGEGADVVQLFSLFGTHERASDEWPNALGGTAESVQESRPGAKPVRVAFTRRSAAGAEEEYVVRFGARQAGFRDGYVGLAIDPDLGAAAHDDSLGYDPQTGLVWVLDPDSGAVGYLVTGRPAGSRITVRQFSRRRDAFRPDPASDSSAFAELSASESALTGGRDDVRFLIGMGPVALSAGDLEMGLVVLRAPTLDELRTHAARVAARQPAVATSRGTGITRFRITQAPPQPGATASIERISPNLIPGLSESTDERQRPAPADLREQVRANGITALAFAVPDGEPARIEVKIHDAAGRLVRRLVDSSYDPGAYRIQWDMLDEGGSRVGPGVYIAVMEAPGFRGTTRLVVVR